MPEPLNPADFPIEIHRNGQPLVPEFDEDEWFYCRFDPAFVLPNSNNIDPLHIKLIPCPDFTSNRSKFSKSWHVLRALAILRNPVVFKFRIHDLPAAVERDGKNVSDHDVKTLQDRVQDDDSRPSMASYT